MRLTRESQSIEEDPARHVDYAYDDAGNVVTLGYPGGSTLATSYDANNRRDVIKKHGAQIADYGYVGPRNRVKNLSRWTTAGIYSRPKLFHPRTKATCSS